MKLRVNYKDEVVDVECSNINTDDNKLNIVFNKDLEDHFQFFINYLIANCILYDTNYSNYFKTIVTDASLFNLAITVNNPVKSSNKNNSLLKAIKDHQAKIDILEDCISKLQKEYDATTSTLKHYNIKTSNFEFVEELNQIRKDMLEYEQNKLLESIKLIQIKLDKTKASAPNVKDLKIAFHVSELIDEAMCEKLLYLREYLMNKIRLTPNECKQLKVLKKLSEYMQKVDANELKNVYSELFTEQCENAAKYVESHKDMELKLEEILKEFYR